MANNSILVSRTDGTVTTGVPTTEYVVDTQVVTNTTTTSQKLGETITGVNLIPYMRALPIEFVASKLRPLRESFFYFDDHPVSNFIQKPNVLKVNKRVSIKGLMDGARDTIKIGSSVANILHVETDESAGNSRIYLADFVSPASISIGASVTSTTNNSLTAAVVSYEHHSGKLGVSNTTHVVLSLDAQGSTDDYYTGNVLTIITGTNAGESREIVGYTAATRTAHISPAFTAADVNSIYSIGDSRSSWSANTIQAHYITSRGYLSGILHIPDPSQNSLKFSTGDRIFRILDNPRNDTTQSTSSAEYRFVANGLNLTKAQLIQQSTINSTETFINILNQPTPTPTPTQTISLTPSSTAGTTPTPTPSASPTGTPAASPTPTKSETPGVTHTPSPTASSTPGSSPTPSISATPSVTPSLSVSQPVTPTPSETMPVTPSPTVSVTISQSPTPGVSPTPTMTNSPSASMPVTPSVSGSMPVTPSMTVTPTATFTQTNTQTPAASLSGTPAITPTTTQTPTQTATPTYSQTPSITPTQTTSITPTPTRTVTPSRTPIAPCDLFNMNGLPRDFLVPYSEGFYIPVSQWLAGNMYIGGYVYGTSKFNIGSYSYTFTSDVTRYSSGKNNWSAEEWRVVADANGMECWSSQLAFQPPPDGDPIAQTFFVATKENPSGVYISSVDLFFKNKGDLLPVQVELRPVVNGFPSSDTVIPGAISVKEPEDIQVSNLPNTQNSKTATRFTFSSPVYLNSGYEYAVVVITDDYGYDYYVCEKGNPALGSGVIASQQSFLGSLFKSQNARTWTPYQNEDMMFVLNRANFTKRKGEVILQEDKTSVSASASGNTVYDAVEIHSDSIQLGGSRLDYKYKSTANSTGLFDSSYTVILPDVKTDMSERKVILPANNSSKSFEMAVQLFTPDSKVSPAFFHNRQSVVAIENRINNSSLSDDRIKIVNGGSGYVGNASITFSSTIGYGANAWAVANNTTGELERIVFDSYGDGYVDSVTANVSGTGTGAELQVISETGKSGGPAEARYISKTVTLLDGFDAGDLRIFLTAVKPAGSNVQVYYKTRNSLDPESLDDRNWVRMVQKTSEFTYSTNREAIEYEFRPSLTSNNIVYSTDTTTYKTFNQFAVKIVLSSMGTTASKIPYVYDLRAIALPGDVY